ncbi:hypothetical protein BV898_17837 [Hypsibius exemplaris]|uniref:Ubiquitin-like protease family profile domain-containing protein n=1 Tax=Hypsibius exemplaris TaxID=2072580 RepID=A0A9X6RMX5_HYPEX|nr:hypothetical protein BV898_17837 [Hypsibius exemplaris]
MIRLCEPAILTPSCSVILRPFALRSGDPSLCNLAALRPCDHCPCNPATLQPGDLDNLHYCERGAPGNPRHCDLATLQLSRLATLTTSTTASLRPGDPAALQIGDPETLRPLLLSSLVPHTSAWCWFTPREDRCLEAEKLGQRIELIGKDTLTNDLEKGKQMKVLCRGPGRPRDPPGLSQQQYNTHPAERRKTISGPFDVRTNGDCEEITTETADAPVDTNDQSQSKRRRTLAADPNISLPPSLNQITDGLPWDSLDVNVRRLTQSAGVPYLQLSPVGLDVLKGTATDLRMTERIANAATYLLRKLVKDTGAPITGLLYQEEVKVNMVSFPADDSHAIQLIHESRDAEHWVAFERKEGRLTLFDSALGTSLSADLKQTIRQLLVKPTGKLDIFIPRVQQQTDGVACGFYAVANLVALVFNQNPATIRLAPSRLRSSLNSFMGAAYLQQFPRVAGRSSNPGQSTVVTI